jgi:hypothetical protein
MADYNKTLVEHTFRPVRGHSNLIRFRLIPSTSVVVLILFATAPRVESSPLDFRPFSPTEILLAQRAIADSVTQTERATNPVLPPALGEPTPAAAAHRASKSSGRAFLYNLLLPGAGHLYAGYSRGWAHLGAEGLTWVTFFYYHDRGATKEDEFEAYANDHWSHDAWIAQCNCAGSSADSLILQFQRNNTQQYYEDIGKIPTYFSGWDAWDQNTGYESPYGDSPYRRFYRGMRNDSNNFFKNARYALVAGFVNRIVSAVDVLRLTKKERTTLELDSNTSIRFKARTKPFNRENAFGVQLIRRI